MERSHRIGQVKPVRVFRLVCSGSVEERMVSRAEKKMYLNAMVAEGADEMEGQKEEEKGNVAGESSVLEVAEKEEEDAENALGIGGGGSMSKSELVSLIRFGANAVVDGAGAGLSEEQLARLLERQGRDKPWVSSGATETTVDSSSTSSSSSNSAKVEVVEENIDDMQARVRDRMEKFKEVCFCLSAFFR